MQPSTQEPGLRESSGPFLAAALMIMLAAVLIRKKKGLYGAAGPLFAYGLTAALFVAPWLIKNMLWAGNPLYPAKIFPGLPYEEKFYYIMQIYNLKPQSAIIRDYFFGILAGGLLSAELGLHADCPGRWRRLSFLSGAPAADSG